MTGLKSNLCQSLASKKPQTVQSPVTRPSLLSLALIRRLECAYGQNLPMHGEKRSIVCK